MRYVGLAAFALTILVTVFGAGMYVARGDTGADGRLNAQADRIGRIESVLDGVAKNLEATRSDITAMKERELGREQRTAILANASSEDRSQLNRRVAALEESRADLLIMKNDIQQIKDLLNRRLPGDGHDRTEPPGRNR